MLLRVLVQTYVVLPMPANPLMVVSALLFLYVVNVGLFANKRSTRHVVLVVAYEVCDILVHDERNDCVRTQICQKIV